MNGRIRQIIVCLLLSAAVLAVYWPVADYDFIALDDNLYVVENQHIRKGFTWPGVSWAMTTFDATNWHPLTWLSLMADYELYGLNAAGYHATNLFLHILNTIFLFLLLRRMTGKNGRCAVVATLFAVHPLNIESVVWIAERKNLLSTLFFLLTIMAYVRYTERPQWVRYWPVLLSFVLGLLAKPMLVTLPLVLFLLDYWPLRRLSLSDLDQAAGIPIRAKRRKQAMGLLLEKAPLFVLSLVSAWITFYAAKAGGAVKAVSVFPLTGRIENALISYAMYVLKAFWPTDLAIFYPYPPSRPFWQVASSILFVSAVTGFVCLKGQTYRYLITGWFWYVITLFPVIGIVQVGFQSMANRYAYISLIGIFVIATWGVPDLLRGLSCRRYLPVVWAAVILVLAFCTQAALPDWKNSELAFGKALRTTKDNHIAEMGMGNVRLGQGDLLRARSHYQQSLRIKPDYHEAMLNLGIVYMKQGLFEDAISQYRKALEISPADAKLLNNLGAAFACQGRHEEAVIRFREALAHSPGYQDAKDNLAKSLKELNKK